ncbi:hypothetical protein ABBQ38_011816 [Trebouxia sp. C0009 RCD-2024]
MPQVTLNFPHRSFISCRTCIGRPRRHQFAALTSPPPIRPLLLARVSREQSKHRQEGAEGKDKPQDPFEELETYHDNAIDKFFINYFASKMSKQLGDAPYEPGYDGFVELSKQIMSGRNSKQQQQAVLGVLEALMPPNAPATFRRLFPFKQWTAELNAAITQKFFAWLVGPLKVQETEVDYKGQKQTWKSGVQIKKCRYLEQSGCKGMCINMCKIPTQTFFTDTFGLPLTMKPNFEDLSCEMVFGETPPPIHLDEVYNEPCFTKNCVLANRDPTLPCPKVDTNRRQTLKEAGMS